MPFNEDIAFYAFRYALGRMTYAVMDVSDYLVANWDELNDNTKKTIVKEITEALKSRKAGMPCDERCWKRLLALAEKDKLNGDLEC